MDLDQGPKKSHGSRPRSGVGGFNVESVYHLHNLYLFEKYSHKKASIRCARKLIGPELIGFETAVGYLPLQTSSKFEADINEGYLFHAARPEQLEAIKQNGLEPPMGHNALSFAESITKAVQDFPSDKHIWVFVVRVCMGKIWMGEHPGPKQNYDSMLTLNGIKGQDTDETLLFREFRIFDKHQAYPEYLLKLTRRQADPDPSNWNIEETCDWAQDMVPNEQAQLLKGQQVSGAILLILGVEGIQSCGLDKEHAETINSAIHELKAHNDQPPVQEPGPFCHPLDPTYVVTTALNCPPEKFCCPEQEQLVSGLLETVTHGGLVFVCGIAEVGKRLQKSGLGLVRTTK